MRKIGFLLAVCISILLVACSNDDSSTIESTDDADHSIVQRETERNDFSNSVESQGSYDQEESDSQDGETASTDIMESELNRKIIYTADLTIEVKNYQQTVEQIQTQVSDRGGYIVESNMHGGQDDDLTSGYVTARIPQDQFQDFINIVENGSHKVLESSQSGQDVTEEYIDLESRLKSKQVVEDRLLSFMEDAEKTEDLLTISNDLAKVQEEIEEIMGRMKYLENRSDLATVTIHIQENNVTLSSMDESDLNTWDQTKQQFLKSVNMLLSFFSGLIVFVIGNLPVLLSLGIIAIVIYGVVRKQKKKMHSNE